MNLVVLIGIGDDVGEDLASYRNRCRCVLYVYVIFLWCVWGWGLGVGGCIFLTSVQ